jgi:signal transduction histidine kinase
MVFVLLLLTLALTGVITYQAQDAVRSYRRTTERVLADYADLAASEFVRRAQIELEFEAFEPGLRAIEENAAGTAAAATPLPPPKPIVVWIDPVTRLSIDLVRYNFRLGLANGGPASHGLSVSGAEASVAAQSWLRDTLAVHARTVYQSDWPCAVVCAPPARDSQIIVYRAHRDSVSGTVIGAVGFAIQPTGLDEYFKYAMGVRPLLPPSLTRGIPRDSLVAIQVRDSYRRTVYQSPWQHDSALWAEDSLGGRFGHLVARATLHPSFPRASVIEGPPRFQLWLLVGLFLTTIGIVLAALLQLRREHELMSLRADFVAGVSHELRTPLAQIRLFAETLLLRRIRSPAEERRSLEIIDQEAQRLTHLVDNVLHFSRVERQAIQVVPESTDVGALASHVVEGWIPLAAARETKLRTAIESGVMASLDPSAGRQMLLNLLDNALKYGPPGQTVTVGVRLAAEDQGAAVGVEAPGFEGLNGGHRPAVAQLLVEDQGPGIPPRDRERIWERFVRLTPASESAVAGTGIGLAVVRELASLHGGRVWVEGHAGGGARFVIELPGAWRASRSPDGATALDSGSKARPGAIE